jgi:uronate dehydrogenase
LQPLRHRSFALLWGAGLVSTIGSWMQAVAVGALLISRTGQATWAVLVAAAAFLPIGLLSPLGGALADRWPRRPVLIAGNLAAAAVAVSLALLVRAGREDPALLVGLVALQGAASAVTGPFQQAILPDLVPQPEFLPAIALNSAQFNLGRIAGPALAGATVAAFGYPVAFAANAASFLAVVAALAFVTLTAGSGPGGSLLASLRDGFRVARGEPSCWAAVWTIAVVALIASPFIALVPAMAQRLVGSGGAAVAAGTAVLTTAQGVGAVAGALCLTGLAARFGRGRVLAGSLVLLPVTLIAYGSAQALWWGAAALFAVGLVYIGVLSGLSTVVQLRAPQAYRGRVLSLYLVALGVAYPVGALLQGPVVDRIGIGWTTTGTALLLSLVMAVVATRGPGVRRALFGTAAGETGPAASEIGPAAGARTLAAWHADPMTAPVPAPQSAVVVLTGAAGRIGGMLRQRLARPGRLLRLVDVAPLTAGPREEVIRASVTDLPALTAACAGASAVIHLAGVPGEAPWEQIAQTNMHGTYAVFEAARRAGTGRVIFASSNHAVGFTPVTAFPVPDYAFPAPDTYYGVSKVVGEALAALYHERYGLDAICLRILTCAERPVTVRALSTWLSPDDAGRLFEACLTADKPGFRVAFGVSANTRGGWVSLAEARALGYEPRDDAESYAAQVIADVGPADPDDPVLAYLGGEFCLPRFDADRLT